MTSLSSEKNCLESSKYISDQSLALLTTGERNVSVEKSTLVRQEKTSFPFYLFSVYSWCFKFLNEVRNGISIREIRIIHADFYYLLLYFIILLFYYLSYKIVKME